MRASTARKRAHERMPSASEIRNAGLDVRAECNVADTSIDPMTALNLSSWLEFQLARWLIRTGRRGSWRISATIARGK